MRRVQIVESLKYGVLMFAYFFGVVVIGGGGIALGAAVGWNAATIRGTGGNPIVYDTPELAAGVVLASLGGFVLFAGLFGFIHKLIADSTAEGVASGPTESATTNTGGVGSVGATGAVDTGESAGAADADDTAETATGTPEPRGTHARNPEAVEATGSADDPAGGPTAEPENGGADDGELKKRTAEQIAFGTDAPARESGDEPEPAIRDATADEGDGGESPDIFTDERAEMTDDQSAGEDEPLTATSDDETVVPEYDEIPTEEAGDESSGERSDDPTGEPFE